MDKPEISRYSPEPICVQSCHGMGLLLGLGGSVDICGAGRLPLDSRVIATCSLLFSLNTWKPQTFIGNEHS